MARGIEPDLGELATQTDPGSLAPRYAVTSAPVIPTTIDRYQVDGMIGAGGMGVVYAAFDPELARPVAIKLISPGAAGEDSIGRATRRLLREAQALARVSHPNVVAVHDVGVVEGQVFVAMELVEGQTLSGWLAARPRTWQEILQVFLDAARGLGAAHAVGIVHRDFKPDNVMIGRDGRVRVLDFGLARPADADVAARTGTHRVPDDAALASTMTASARTPELRMTLTQGLAGTPLYMAPEQFAPGAGVDHRVDQFALCVALYRALHGVHPFSDGDFEKLRAAVIAGAVKAPPRGSRVPAHVDAALRRGMSPDRAARFPDMEALVAALAPARRRPRWPLALALGLAAAAAALVAVVTWRPAPPSASAPSRVSAALGLQRQLTWRGDALAPSFSPDDEQLAFLTREGVHVMDAATGVERLIIGGSYDRYVEWMPDGRSLLTWSAAKGIVQIEVATGRVSSPLGWVAAPFATPVGNGALATTHYAARAVTIYPLDGFSPPRTCRIDVDHLWSEAVAGSPAGDRVAVAIADRSDTLMIWTVGADCSDWRQAASDLGPGLVTGFRWTEAGIFLLVQEHDEKSRVVRVPVGPDGAAWAPAEIIVDELDAAEGIAVARDGRIAYVRADPARNLVWLGREPVVQRPLTNDSARRSLVALSPEGGRVAFEERAGPRRRLVVLDVRTGRQVQALELPGGASGRGLAWSPDGDALVLNEVVGGEGQLWIQPLDGGERVGIPGALTSSSSEGVAWAPDGRILYQETGNQNFIWVGPDGTEHGVLVRDPWRGWIFAPVVSPDASLAAVYANRKDGGTLLVSTATGHSRQLVGARGRQIPHPLAWSPDGAWVYVVFSEQIGSTQVLHAVERVRLRDGAVERWWELPSPGTLAEIALSPDGSWAVAAVGSDRRDLWIVGPGG